jgi:putative transposase
MQKGESRRSGAPVWRERVTRQAASGLSVGEFCRRERVSAWSFYRWRLRLRAEDGSAKGALKRAELVRREPPSQAGAFIDLGALPAMTEGPGWEIRLELGGGVILQLARR